MNGDLIFQWLGVAVVASPVVLLSVLGMASMVGVKLRESTIAGLTQACVIFGLTSAM